MIEKSGCSIIEKQSRNMKRLFLLLLVFAALNQGAFAKAYFQTGEEMIRKATVIAIVTITGVQASGVRGKTWTYRQVGDATVESVLKGDIPGRIKLYGMEDFICAQCPLSEGRFLAFLKKDGDLWTGSNWDLSLRPISGTTVAWYADDHTRHEMKPLPLADVLGRIKTATSP